MVAPVSQPTLTPRTWMAIALLGAVAAGLLSLRQSDGGLTWNVWLFLQLNQLGALAPTAWSIWTVSGLGLSAYVALALVDAPPRGRAASTAPTAAQAQAQSQLLAALIWSFVVGGLVTQGAKHLLHAARPPAVLGVDAITVIGEALMSNSMPSGHATTAAALATLLCLSGRIGWRGQALAWLWSLGVLLSRIAVGAHWPVDVCVGLGLGIAIAHLGSALAARGELA
ncbi:MAG: phosphatase PAP2 family protein, partial [Leptothrix sp. (in: b-proteobacteria)]